MQASKFRFAVFLYLVGMVAIHAIVFWHLRDSVRKGYSDFAIYYCAGTMVRQGLGRQLYDETIQFKVQREFSPDVAIRLAALPYNHPPFEALLFFPFTYLRYPLAFALWNLANLALLVTLPLLLRPHLFQLQNYSYGLWLIASLAFFPIFVALLQGQDTILLLLLYALCFVCLKKNRDGIAGMWLALGLFKPHLVLPFVLLLLVQGKKKLLYGFLPTAAAMLLVSIVIVGGEGMLLYPRYVLHLESTMARGAIVPSNMPNLRGVVYVLFSGSSSVNEVALLISAGVFLFAVWQCRSGPSKNLVDLKFCLAMVATVLVSYHLLSYDLSVLMVPLFLLANELLGEGRLHAWQCVLIVGAVSALYFSPGLILLMRNEQLALAGWAVVLLMGGIAGQVHVRMRQQGEAV
jgi:Glycosyltransferase family 87